VKEGVVMQTKLIRIRQSMLLVGMNDRIQVPYGRHVTYQKQYRTCGKAMCACRTGKKHGPYIYAFWREGIRLRSAYIGKVHIDTDAS